MPTSLQRSVDISRLTTSSKPLSTPMPTMPTPLMPTKTRELPSGVLNSTPGSTRRLSAKTSKSIKAGIEPPKPKTYQPLQSKAIERRAKASTLAIGDTPRRSFKLDDENHHIRLASKMSSLEYDRFQSWCDNISDTPDMLCDKLERNSKDNKDRLRKLNETISSLTSDMKDFRSAKEDWDNMVDMTGKLVKRKRSATKDALDRIDDANHQIGRELTRNFPYIPYEMLVDFNYAASCPVKA